MTLFLLFCYYYYNILLRDGRFGQNGKVGRLCQIPCCCAVRFRRKQLHPYLCVWSMAIMLWQQYELLTLGAHAQRGLQ